MKAQAHARIIVTRWLSGVIAIVVLALMIGVMIAIVASEVINLTTWDQELQVGAAISVRYLPSNPSLCRIEHIGRAGHG